MRYFIVFFEGVDKEEDNRRGHIGFPHANFPPFRAVSGAIATTYDLDRVVITGINEVPKVDYDNWILNDEDEVLDFE